MDDISTIAGWLDEEYNRYMSVYEYTGSDPAFVRLTNGSGGAMIDIQPVEDGFELAGRWYDREADRSVTGGREELLAVLGRVV
jgi:hypothetical protein